MMCRLIAGLLLLLDLSQEPASAFPLSMADSDDDTVTELCTKETFWCGPSADEQNIYAAIRSKQHAIYTDRGISRTTTPIVCSERVRAPKQVVAAYSQKYSDVLCAATFETPYPLFVASIGSPAARADLDPSLAALLTVRLLI
jgi:hypothetical protein